jgi:hypothetical protein
MVFNTLYCSVEGLDSVLQGYRLFFVLDFIQDTVKDLLNEYADRLTEREIHVCRVLSRDKTIAYMKRHTFDVPTLRRRTAMLLYEVFKICRKLPITDKEIVMANFNQLRIGK